MPRPPQVRMDENRLQAMIVQKSFYQFVKAAWAHVEPAPFIDNWHIGAMCEHLQAVTSGQIKKLLINVPPGCSKSLVTSVYWPMWEWLTNPSSRWFFASYDQRLSTRDSVRSRTLIETKWYRGVVAKPFTLAEDQNQKTYFENSFGGYRLATSVGGHGTGEHPSRVCLPWEGRVITDRGELPIGQIVDQRLPVKVLSYNHQQNVPEWREIDDYEQSPGRELYKIHFSAMGNTLKLTAEHPVYVIDKGYVPVINLKEGDVVIYGEKKLPELWSRIRDQAKWKSKALQFQLLQRKKKKGIDDSLYKLREAGTQVTQSTGEDKTRGILQPPMSRRLQPRAKSPLFQRTNQGDLLQLWQGFGTSGPYKKDRLGLQSKMPRRMVTVSFSEKSSKDTENLSLRQNHSRLSQDQDKQVLFKTLREPGPQRTHVGEGQSSIYLRGFQGSVLKTISKKAAGSGPKQGTFLLFSLRQNRETKWQKIRCTSRRLSQKPRFQKESRGIMQIMPFQERRRETAAFNYRTAIVSHVEKTLWIPKKVYNLNIRGNHNYFASGVLVHNCIDDPHRADQAESENERQSVIDWRDLTMSTRGVTLGVRWVIIMQRLHENDLAGHVLKDGDWEHLCLPMRFERGRMKTTSIGFSDPRTAEGELLSPRQFDEATVATMEKRLGPYGSAGQLQQRPQPKGGGLFKEEHFSGNRVKAAPYDANRVIYWDLAHTASKSACRTVGTVVHEKDGEYYVGPVWVGQWEPFERDNKILAAAQYGRDRWGPNHEPTTVIEEEPTAGKDLCRAIIRKLAGFKARADKVRRSKLDRADAYASQCAAGAVHLVDDGCLVAGTMITRQGGDRPIELVKQGDFVWTRDGWRIVKWSGITKTVTSLVEVLFDNGSTIIGTANHPIWTENRGWIHLDDCNWDDKMLSIQPKSRNNLSWVKKDPSQKQPRKPLHSMESTTTSVDPLSISAVTWEVSYTELSGRSILERSQMDMRFITKTGIKSTTHSLTLSAYLKGYTAVFIHRLQNTSRILTGSGISPWRGIKLMRDAGLQVKQLKQTGVNDKKHFIRACSVGSRLSPAAPSYCSALLDAQVNSITMPVRISTIEFVKNVESSSNHKAKKRDTVLQNVEERLEGIPVYNLEVEGTPEFFANGILVHNSWDVVGWVREHAAFPNGNYLDRVDSAGGGFNWLANNRGTMQLGRFRILRNHVDPKKKKVLRFTFGTTERLSQVIIEERAILVMIRDPGEEPALVSKHHPAFTNLLDAVDLAFVQREPSDMQDRWDKPFEEYGGLLPEHVVMKPDQARQFWANVLRVRDQTLPAEVVVVVDDGDGQRAKSVAYAAADAMGFKRAESVFDLAEPEWMAKDEPAPCLHVYKQTKALRNAVVG